MKKHWDNPIEHLMPAAVRVPAEVRIGSVAVAPATVLAPMAGVTDTVFRRFIRNASLFTHSADSAGRSVEDAVTNAQSGCGLLMTEFTSADGLARMRESKRKRYLTFYDDEHPIGAQLFGSNPETLAEAARIVEETGFDLVDLNLGCPAKRVVGCNGGSGLLRDLPRIGEIFRTIRKAVSIPFTVKFRTGWNDSQIVCVELARMAEGEGLNGVALHARTREQGYSGQAQWHWIARVKQAVSIPVTGNGDIRTPEDAAAMIAETGCDAVMIGRAAPANPWIFRQIAQYTATGAYESPTTADRYHMIRAYFEMLLAEGEATQALAREAHIGDSTGKMKQFATWFTHGVPNGAKLRAAIYQARSGRDVLGEVERFFTAAIAAGDEAAGDSEITAPGFVDAAFACDCG
ncbi:MAG TPA: tRNA dihydrouridine synthase DusB [Terracidiphilus sp.]|nr:tRNA dihydrouridine synthase DusB [Terracidiphilus sp.]